jgi:hypothetical protein
LKYTTKDTKSTKGEGEEGKRKRKRQGKYKAKEQKRPKNKHEPVRNARHILILLFPSSLSLFVTFVFFVVRFKPNGKGITV